MRKLYVLFIVILFISGCASIQVVSTTKHRVGQSIEFDKIATANVGDVIFTQYTNEVISKAT